MNKSLKCKILTNAFLRRNCSFKSVRRPDLNSNRKLTAPQIEPTIQNAANNFTKQIKNKILATGPITVADYMREVLTNPISGYYMNRDVFGREGDFTTSPEISQIFGELVGIWIINEWHKIGAPSPFQIVELGPGRGTLARDVLKVLAKFKLSNQFSMHMVEISPHLSQMQAQRFCYKHREAPTSNDALPYYQSGETATGINVFWHRRLEDVPHEFSIVLAHEFFDALPVHKLQLDAGVWKEILVDVHSDITSEEKSASTNDGQQFRFVLSKAQTPISKIYKPFEGETRECLEYSMEADRIIHMMSERFERDGGIGLIMDYGHFGEKTDTFRAFRRHQLHDPLVDPGTADLTADVDFRQLKRAAEENGQVFCFGPVEQGFFLDKMQGKARLELLLGAALPENQDMIKSGYEMLTSPNQMGKRFKFFSMFPSVLKDHLTKYPVSGFN